VELGGDRKRAGRPRASGRAHRVQELPHHIAKGLGLARERSPTAERTCPAAAAASCAAAARLVLGADANPPWRRGWPICATRRWIGDR